MNPDRRHFLIGAAASAVPFSAPAIAESLPQSLRAAVMNFSIDGVAQQLLGFNGSLPGPELRLDQDRKFEIRVTNDIPDDGLLVHWHGLRLPNGMDGVNVLTQNPIEPGETFDYRFEVKDAGTFWYHSHYQSYDQVSRGLFGAFIVQEREPPLVDHDIVVQLFDILVNQDGLFDEELDPAQFSGAGRIGNVSLAIFSKTTARKGERVRLRLINPSIDRVYDIGVNGFDGAIVALDAMPVGEPRAFSTVRLGPGQRCDLIGDVVGELSIVESGSITLGRITIEGARERRSSDISALPPNATQSPRGGETTVTLDLQGGAGAAEHGGTGSWALNDVSGLASVPLLDVRRGTTARIKLRNFTHFDHVMHLHGHHFWEVDGAGNSGDFRDSTMIGSGEVMEILCVLDNPGNWMLHCHMLSHQADGMATWLRVR